jgi:sRNA-binding carbon storage regulator CsrA
MHMVTSLATGDKIHVGNSVTLTLIAIDGDLVCLEIESSTPGGRGVEVLIEGAPKSDRNWWASN